MTKRYSNLNKHLLLKLKSEKQRSKPRTNAKQNTLSSFRYGSTDVITRGCGSLSLKSSMKRVQLHLMKQNLLNDTSQTLFLMNCLKCILVPNVCICVYMQEIIVKGTEIISLLSPVTIAAFGLPLSRPNGMHGTGSMCISKSEGLSHTTPQSLMEAILMLFWAEG